MDPKAKDDMIPINFAIGSSGSALILRNKEVDKMPPVPSGWKGIDLANAEISLEVFMNKRDSTLWYIAECEYRNEAGHKVKRSSGLQKLFSHRYERVIE